MSRNYEEKWLQKIMSENYPWKLSVKIITENYEWKLAVKIIRKNYHLVYHWRRKVGICRDTGVSKNIGNYKDQITPSSFYERSYNFDCSIRAFLVGPLCFLYLYSARIIKNGRVSTVRKYLLDFCQNNFMGVFLPLYFYNYKQKRI